MRRLDIWLKSHGFDHAPGCTLHGGNRRGIRAGGCPDAGCPFGSKRADLIEQLGGIQALGRAQKDNRPRVGGGGEGDGNLLYLTRVMLIHIIYVILYYISLA